jgi:hypothetical protein
MLTLPTRCYRRLTANRQHGSFCQRSLAEYIKVKLYRVIYKATQLTNDQGNTGDTSRTGLSGRVKRGVEHTLSKRKFMHDYL